MEHPLVTRIRKWGFPVKEIPDMPVMEEAPAPICPWCNREPEDIGEYKRLAKEYGLKPNEAVRQEEGTYSRKHNMFCCTDCYIKIGLPHQAEMEEKYTFFKNNFIY